MAVNIASLIIAIAPFEFFVIKLMADTLDLFCGLRCIFQAINATIAQGSKLCAVISPLVLGASFWQVAMVAVHNKKTAICKFKVDNITCLVGMLPCQLRGRKIAMAQ